MNAAVDIITRVIGLLPLLWKWIEALMNAGKSLEEAEEIVKRDIQSRLEEVRANRAERDAEFERKHGEPLGKP